jgi:hypothetical protein
MLEKLDISQRRVVNNILKNSVNFLAGTISPSRANKISNDIESLELAFNHYYKNGVDSVIIQPKYMGNRCQLYIFSDISKCYAISKNGYKINKVDLLDIFEERHNFWFKSGENLNIKLVIEDGELMPWSILGRGLIDGKFIQYSKLFKNELNLLNQISYNEAIGKKIDQGKGLYIDLLKRDVATYSDFEKTFIKDYKLFLNSVTEKGFNFFKECIDKFDHQIDIFGKDSNPYYKPFNILKIEFNDGDNIVLVDYNYKNYEYIGKDEYIISDTKNWDTMELKRYLHNFIYINELEGIVIKPLEYSSKYKCAPYLKVRNKEYLRIVYGPDYDSENKLKTLIDKKSIRDKVKLSIKEYIIGREMLSYSIDTINVNNSDYVNILVDIMLCIYKHDELDPRL